MKWIHCFCFLLMTPITGCGEKDCSGYADYCPLIDVAYQNWIRIHENDLLIFENEQGKIRGFKTGKAVTFLIEDDCQDEGFGRCECWGCSTGASIGFEKADDKPEDYSIHIIYGKPPGEESIDFKISMRGIGSNNQTKLEGAGVFPAEENNVQLGSRTYKTLYKLHLTNWDSPKKGYVYLSKDEGIVGFKEPEIERGVLPRVVI